MIFETCNTCAIALVNCDMSGLEYSHGIEDMDRIVASIESMGLVTMTKAEANSGYFECFVCGQICLGDKSFFERV